MEKHGIVFSNFCGNPENAQQYKKEQWLSLEIKGLRVPASLASLHCVLEQDTLILA